MLETCSLNLSSFFLLKDHQFLETIDSWVAGSESKRRTKHDYDDLVSQLTLKNGKLRFRFLNPFATYCFILLKSAFFRIKELNVSGVWFMFFKTVFYSSF